MNNIYSNSDMDDLHFYISNGILFAYNKHVLYFVFLVCLSFDIYLMDSNDFYKQMRIRQLKVIVSEGSTNVYL